MTDAKKIFVDTSAWIEALLPGEKYHKIIGNYLLKNQKSGSHFITNDYVLDEAWTRLITNQSYYDAKKLREKILLSKEMGELTLLYIDESFFHKSWKTFEKFSDHKLSFTDSVIITQVKEFKIDEILTLDQGFKKAGLKIHPDLGRP